MTDAMRLFLDAYEALSEGDKHLATVEIRRRNGLGTEGDLPGAALVEAADELFRALDEQERLPIIT